MSYPVSIGDPLLSETHTINPNPSLTTLNARQLYNIYFPYTATQMGSFRQETNNKRHWPSPDNGTSPWMGLNNSMYVLPRR